MKFNIQYFLFFLLIAFVPKLTIAQCFAPSATINAGSGNPNQSTVYVCADGSNTVTFKVPGGITDHSVIWQYSSNNGNTWTQLTVSPNNTQFENIATFSSVQPGLYRFQSGASSCGASPSPNLTLSPVTGIPSAPTLSASSNIICPSVTLTATLDNSAFQNTYYLQPATVVSNIVTQAGSYYATATNVCGASPASNIIPLTAGTSPTKPTITLPSLPLCDAGSGTLTASGDVADTYAWYLNGVVIPGETNQTISVTAAGDYTVEETNGCATSSRSSVATVTTATSPTKNTITLPSLPLCNGNSGTLTASGNVASTFAWYLNGVAIPGETNKTISVTAAGDYTVEETNGCATSPRSNIATVTTGAKPTKNTITLPSLPLCNGNPGTLTASGNVANTFTWYLNGTVVPGETNKTVSVTAAGDYTVEETNGCGTSTKSDVATVTTSATPAAPSISPVGPFNLCDNVTQGLTATGSATLTWYFNGSANGTTGVSFTASQQGNYTVKSINVCGTSPASNSVSVFTNVTPPKPTLNVSGSILLCNGISQTLSTTPSTTGGVIHWSTGAISNSISVNTAGSYYAYESNSTCGLGPNSSSVTITTNNDPVVNAITGSGSVCAGSTITLANTTNGGVWSSPDNSIATVDASGNVTGVSAGTVNIKYAVTNSCGTTNVFKSITVNALPPLNPIVGFNTVCKNASIHLTNSQSGGVWSSGTPANGTIDGLGNVTGINAGTTTLITYTYTDANTCTNSVNKTITINALPVVTVTGVMNTTNVVMTGGGANTYSWSSGEATQSITKPVSTTATYNVVGTDVNGCNGNALYSVNSSPNSGATSISSSNGTVFCSGSSTTLTASSGDSYYWSTGATTQNINVSASGTYTVYVSHNATNSVEVANINITVDPTTIGGTVTADATVCSGTNGAVLNLSGSTGAVQNWEYSTNSGGSWTSIINTSTSQVYLNLTTTTLYRAVVKSGSCPSANSSSATITVNPIPDVNTISNQVVCNNASTIGINFSGSVFSTIYNWVNNTPSIGLSASGAGSISAFNALNGSVAPVVATITVTPTAAGCVGPSKNFTITVNPTPSVNSISNQVLCNGSATAAVSFNGPVGSTSFSWTNNTTYIGLAASGFGDISSFNAINNGNTPVVATVTVTPTANSCSGPTGSFTIKVNPTPNVTVISDQILCNGSSASAINFSGTVSGTQFSWTNTMPSIGIPGSGNGNIVSFAAINNQVYPVTANIAVTASANGCIYSSQTETKATSGNLSVSTVEADGTTYSITVGATTLAIYTKQATETTTTQIAEQLVSLVNAGFLTHGYSAQNSGSIIFLTAPAGSGSSKNGVSTSLTWNGSSSTIISTTTFANGVDAIGSVFNIKVKPTPKLTSVLLAAAICDSTTFSYRATSLVGGTTYTWSRPVVSGITNLSSSGNTALISEVLKNTTTDSVVVDYNFILSSAGCSNPQTVSIPVRPTNRLSSPYTAVVCDSSLFNYTALSSVASKYAPSFSWTRAAVPGISNAAGSGGSAMISEVLKNTTTDSVVVKYAITMASATGCSHTDSLFVTVRPTNRLSSAYTAVVCDSSLFNYTALSSVASKYAPSFSWIRAAVPGIANAAGSGGSAMISEVLKNTTTDSVVVKYAITMASATGCSHTDSLFVTVRPTNRLSSPYTAVVCDSSLFSYTALSSVASKYAPSFSWTRAAVPGIANAAGSGGSAMISEVLKNTTTDSVVVKYAITMASATGCSHTDSLFVTVRPTNRLSSAYTAVVCDSSFFSYTALSSVASKYAPSFSWTRAAVPGIANAAGSGSSARIRETLKNTTTDSIVVKYAISMLSATGCTHTDTLVVTVRPTPRMNSSYTAVVCDSSLFNYTAFSSVASKYAPSFSWTRAAVPGIANAAGSGGSAMINEVLHNNTTDSVVVKYAISMLTTTGCTHTDTLAVTIRPTPRMNSSYTAVVCDSSLFNYTAFSSVASKYAPSFSWTRAAVPGIANAAGSGGSAMINEVLHNTTTDSIVVKYAISMLSATGCTHTDTLAVTVRPTPRMNSFYTAVVCDSSLFNYTAFSSVASKYAPSFSWTRAAVPGIANAAGSGGSAMINEVLHNNTTDSVVVKYAISMLTTTGCTHTDTLAVTIRPTPRMNSSYTAVVCDSSLFNYTAFSSVASKYAPSFSWTRAAVPGIANAAGSGGSAMINEVLHNTTTDSIVVKYAISMLSATGCTHTDTLAVTVRPTPRMNSFYTAVVCDSSLFNYTAFSSVASKYAPSFSWTRAAVPGIANAAGSGGSAMINEVLHNNTTDSVVVKYAISMLTTTGCTHTDTLAVTIRPTPRMNSSYTAVVCDSSLFNYTAFSSVASKYAPSFSWTRAAVPGIANAAGSGGSAMISERLIDTANTVLKVPYAITMASNGCMHTDTLVTTVINRPYGSISTTPTDTVSAAKPLILNLSTPDTLRMKYAWDFGDGITANTNLLSVQHYYYSSVQIKPLISLKATNSYGCYRTVYRSIVVLADSTPKPIDTIAVQHHYKMVVFPNPFTTVLHLQYSNPGPDEEAIIRANDMGGNNIYIKRMMLLHGDHIIDLPIDRVEKKQVYNFWLSSKSFKHEQKFYRDPAF